MTLSRAALLLVVACSLAMCSSGSHGKHWSATSTTSSTKTLRH